MSAAAPLHSICISGRTPVLSEKEEASDVGLSPLPHESLQDPALVRRDPLRSRQAQTKDRQPRQPRDWLDWQATSVIYSSCLPGPKHLQQAASDPCSSLRIEFSLPRTWKARGARTCGYVAWGSIFAAHDSCLDHTPTFTRQSYQCLRCLTPSRCGCSFLCLCHWAAPEFSAANKVRERQWLDRIGFDWKKPFHYLH